MSGETGEAQLVIYRPTGAYNTGQHHPTQPVMGGTSPKEQDSTIGGNRHPPITLLLGLECLPGYCSARDFRYLRSSTPLSPTRYATT